MGFARTALAHGNVVWEGKGRKGKHEEPLIAGCLAVTAEQQLCCMYSDSEGKLSTGFRGVSKSRGVGLPPCWCIRKCKAKKREKKYIIPWLWLSVTAKMKSRVLDEALRLGQAQISVTFGHKSQSCP